MHNFSKLISKSAFFATLTCTPAVFGAYLTPTAFSTSGVTNFSTCATPVACDGYTGLTLTATSTATVSGTWKGTAVIGYGTDATTGDLDFLLQVSPSGNNGDAGSVTLANFLSSSALPEGYSVGYLTTDPGGSFVTPTSTTSPTSASDVSGTGVKFIGNPLAVTGQSSDVLVVRTDAPTTSLNGPYTVQDTTVGFFAGYQPTPEPAQSAFLLAGVLVSGLYLARKFTVVRL